MSAEKAEDGAAKEEEKRELGKKTSGGTDQRAKSRKRKRRRKSAAELALEFFIKILLTIFVIWLLCTRVGGVYVNHGNSAYPMVKDGDLCITYRLGDFREGEEIAYKQEGEIRFGRIAAMGGDVVEIRDEVVLVNGYSVLEDVVYPTASAGSQITYPYTVPEDSVFVLNDYRDDVSDSRSFGAVPLEDTRGKVVFVMRRRGI